MRSHSAVDVRQKEHQRRAEESLSVQVVVCVFLHPFFPLPSSLYLDFAALHLSIAPYAVRLTLLAHRESQTTEERGLATDFWDPEKDASRPSSPVFSSEIGGPHDSAHDLRVAPFLAVPPQVRSHFLSSFSSFTHFPPPSGRLIINST
jgi:hypothetical protein